MADAVGSNRAGEHPRGNESVSTSPHYLNPDLPCGLKRFEIPVVEATDESLRGMGQIVESPDEVEIEIVRWPALGWRPVDPDSGNEGGTREGKFVCQWRGDVLYGENTAVGGHSILGYGASPESAREDHYRPPRALLLWHCNYHPDGGQLFFPKAPVPFLAPLAPRGDNVRPEDFICFRFDGRRGLYIHPNTWHDGVYPVSGRAEFYGRQGAVHARVSVDFAREFGCLLSASISET